MNSITRSFTHEFKVNDIDLFQVRVNVASDYRGNYTVFQVFRVVPIDPVVAVLRFAHSERFYESFNFSQSYNRSRAVLRDYFRILKFGPDDLPF